MNDVVKTAAAVLVFCAAMAIVSPARAGEPASPASKQSTVTDAKGRKVTVVDFDDASIEGRAKAPDGFVLNSRASGTLKTVIELRRNFRSQIQGSAYEGLLANPTSP